MTLYINFIFPKQKQKFEASEMVQWVQTHASNPGCLSLSPDPYGRRRDPSPSGCLLISIHVLWHTHSYNHCGTYRYTSLWHIHVYITMTHACIYYYDTCMCKSLWHRYVCMHYGCGTYMYTLLWHMHVYITMAHACIHALWHIQVYMHKNLWNFKIIKWVETW